MGVLTTIYHAQAVYRIQTHSTPSLKQNPQNTMHKLFIVYSHTFYPAYSKSLQ
jgi:hypothetical protein